MDRDLRETPLYRELEEVFRKALEPGFGRPLGVDDVQRSPDGRWLAFHAERLDALDGRPRTRICLVPADGSAEVRQITNGPNDDANARWSPDGRTLTFRSDREREGDAQLYALDAEGFGEARPLPLVPGVAEQHAWSPDGSRLLVVVAGLDAEQSDAIGSGTIGAEEGLPAWIPEVESSDRTDSTRRRLFAVDPVSGDVRPAAREDLNVWEAAWCGPDQIVAIVSEGTSEAAWYTARLAAIDPAAGTDRTMMETDVQLGWVSASPSGSMVGVIEAVCSDRLVVAGDLLLVDPEEGAVRRVESPSVDVGRFVWIDDDRILAAGFRGLDSVILDVDAKTATAQERWATAEACGSWFGAAPTALDGGFAFPVESWRRPTELIAVDDDGVERTLVRSSHEGTDLVTSWIGSRQRVAWSAHDDLEIEGLLTLPFGTPPFPLILQVHGGPISAYQDSWPGVVLGQLVARGYAVLQPNPRGSWGRGRAFAAMVVGDMGGDDAKDVLAGVDHVVGLGLADPDRIGVEGGSYGGFMAAWLPCIDPRFKAAVSLSPVTDWYSERFESNLGSWATDFLGGDPIARQDHYHERSPVLRAASNRTPTLFTAGYKDRATPLGQAVEMYRILREHDVPAEVALYPLEGHGVRSFPAVIDATARIVAWFERFMPPGPVAR